MSSEEKRKPGRPTGSTKQDGYAVSSGAPTGPRDKELAGWLDEYRGLLEQPEDSEQPEAGSRWDFLNKAHIEQVCAMRKGILSRWWGRKTSGPSGSLVTLNREEFFGLLRWTPGPVPNVPDAWLL